MANPKEWIEVRPEGLYCVPGGFYIDPHRSVGVAVITHGHADHARFGHKHVIATQQTVAIMKMRFGEDSAEIFQSLAYHQAISINGVTIYLLPAGHILGSAQVVLQFSGAKLIISGDYKRALDYTCEPFVAESCDVFITEATFGLPVFVHPPIEHELQKLLDSLAEFPAKSHLVGSYALGKCQRIITTLRMMGYHETIFLHGALIKLCHLYQSLGVELGSIAPATLDNKASFAGKLILCPPSALHDKWSRRFGDKVIATASGWMQIRARAKQKRIDLPLIISDHADWNELVQTLHEVNAPEVWVTHGREEALVYYANQHHFKAQALKLLGYEDDSQED
jgi:putative mRNA 3-end processing factor